MNWGVKIFITLIVFMAAAVSTGIYMVSQDQDSLIEDEYYETGLHFDSAYVQKHNVKNMDAEPEINIEDNFLIITFKQKVNKGTLTFQRTSDSSLDRKLPFTTTDNIFKIPTESFTSGAWKMIINWNSDATSFLFEKNITIP